MKKTLFAAAFFVPVLCSLALAQDTGKAPASKEAPANPAGSEEERDVWMRMKLKYSQNIYASIAQADVGAIGVDARRMKALNWFEGIAHGKDAAYQEQLQVFRLANDKLFEEAAKNNLDGCTLAFMQMTFSCTACHKRLRDAAQPKPLHEKPRPPASK